MAKEALWIWLMVPILLHARLLEPEEVRAHTDAIQIGAFSHPQSIARIERLFDAYDLLPLHRGGLTKIYIVNIPPAHLRRTLLQVRKRIKGAFVAHLDLGRASKRRQRGIYAVEVGCFAAEEEARRARERLAGMKLHIRRSGRSFVLLTPSVMTFEAAHRMLQEIKKKFPNALLLMREKGQAPFLAHSCDTSKDTASTSSSQQSTPARSVEKKASGTTGTPPAAALPLDSETILRTRKKFY